jgi:hypothetical protein
MHCPTLPFALVTATCGICLFAVAVCLAVAPAPCIRLY